MRVLDFNNKNLWVLFEASDGTIVHVTESILSTWIVMGILILLAIIVRIKVTRFKSIPRGFQNVIEAAIEMLDNFTISTTGPGLGYMGGIFFSFFIFILTSNYIGLTGLRPPTSDAATTLALALSTVFLIHFVGFRHQKLGYFKSFLKPYPFFLPFNLISEFSKPISLTFRLFGNLLSGVIIVGLVYEKLPIFLRFIFPTVVHAYFDIFAGGIQAFIFTVISMSYISSAFGEKE